VTAILWLRRDLRLADHPALESAAAAGPVVALYVLDPVLLGAAGPPRIAFLLRTLRALDADLAAQGGGLLVRTGRPAEVVADVAGELRARSVHVSADFGRYGQARDDAVARALGDRALVAAGSPYAVPPGRVRTASGTPFKVFTPFYRAWSAHGWPTPTASPAVEWQAGAGSTGGTGGMGGTGGEPIPADPELPSGLELPAAGERAALNAWRAYRRNRLAGYAAERDRPDLDATSHLSVYLKWGCVHPRTLLGDLGPADEVFRRELAWREFYAAVLHAWPASAREAFRPALAGLAADPPTSPAFHAWCTGRTGYPLVDAGLRQLLGQGWMHNRLRMIVASFLVKDLHIDWTHGARHFMRLLVDADLASNQHGWQWVAGTGTDAAPFVRVFNPTTQAHRIDPHGDFVRRWVPELRGIPGAAVHEPWRLDGGPPAGYPAPIVDHAQERLVALARYRAATITSG
jgi:deoxyribodipyrimidine photo-lyase